MKITRTYKKAHEARRVNVRSKTRVIFKNEGKQITDKKTLRSLIPAILEALILPLSTTVHWSTKDNHREMSFVIKDIDFRPGFDLFVSVDK